MCLEPAFKGQNQNIERRHYVPARADLSISEPQELGKFQQV